MSCGAALPLLLCPGPSCSGKGAGLSQAACPCARRIKRIRDKYEVELQELERSERKLQERCSELKGRLAELEGESMRLQGLLKHKEQELEEVRKVSEEQSQGPAWPVPGCAGAAVPGPGA